MLRYKSSLITIPMTGRRHTYAAHPLDVLSQWLDWRQSGPTALVVVTGTVGGSVRAPGALMAVAQDGRKCGYISGGCIDADVALRAAQSISTGQVTSFRYGAGSPFLDMPLPCGGAIDVTISPNVPISDIRHCRDALAARRPADFSLPGLAPAFRYVPKLKIRVAGRGADALALAQLVAASGFELKLQLRDGEDVADAQAAGLTGVEALVSPSQLPPVSDDAWTAFVLMFHDPAWERALLKQALAGQAFYVGAVGSKRTQERRLADLVADGVSEADARRTRGPIGLVPAMRDASMLSISVLAEIVAQFGRKPEQPFAKTAIVLLAAGSSQRFGRGDKLMADLDGRPVLAHAADSLFGQKVAARIAVTGPDHDARRALLEASGWKIVTNADAASGQASSLQAGIRAAADVASADHVLVLLGDMPRVSSGHLLALREAVARGAPAVMSLAKGIPSPPAILSRSILAQLGDIRGDRGARDALLALAGLRTVPLADAEGIDIDTPEDLVRASACAIVEEKVAL